jgi:hypothetical protein
MHACKLWSSSCMQVPLAKEEEETEEKELKPLPTHSR